MLGTVIEVLVMSLLMGVLRLREVLRLRGVLGCSGVFREVLVMLRGGDGGVDVKGDVGALWGC